MTNENYQGPEIESLPQDVAELVEQVLKRMSKINIALEQRNWDGGIDPHYGVNLGDFEIVYVANKDDTDIETLLMFRENNQYTMRFSGEPGRREVLAYDPNELWTLAKPGDKIQVGGVYQRRFGQWIEAKPKVEGYTLGRNDREPMNLN